LNAPNGTPRAASALSARRENLEIFSQEDRKIGRFDGSPRFQRAIEKSDAPAAARTPNGSPFLALPALPIFL
jgi:hypothetical protein